MAVAIRVEGNGIGIDAADHEPISRQLAQCEDRLVLRRRRGRRKATWTGGPIPAAATPSARRSLDVMHDQRVSGRRLCFLSVADDVRRECLAVVVGTPIAGRRGARALEAKRGKPALIVPDRSAVLTSNAVLARTRSAGVAWHVIAPG
ncbi:MAG: hypothetical protein AAFV86_24370 [Pseudomonadota bacterium]